MVINEFLEECKQESKKASTEARGRANENLLNLGTILTPFWLHLDSILAPFSSFWGSWASLGLPRGGLDVQVSIFNDFEVDLGSVLAPKIHKKLYRFRD